LHIINFNILYFRVENETTLISAKNRVNLSSISEVRSYITEWPRFFGPPCINASRGVGYDCCSAIDRRRKMTTQTLTHLSVEML